MLSARSNAQKSSMSFVLLLLFPVLRHWKCTSQYILLAVELTLLLGVAPTRLPTTARVAPEKKEKKRKEEEKKERKKTKRKLPKTKGAKRVISSRSMASPLRALCPALAHQPPMPTPRPPSNHRHQGALLRSATPTPAWRNSSTLEPTDHMPLNAVKAALQKQHNSQNKQHHQTHYFQRMAFVRKQASQMQFHHLVTPSQRPGMTHEQNPMAYLRSEQHRG